MEARRWAVPGWYGIFRYFEIYRVGILKQVKTIEKSEFLAASDPHNGFAVLVATLFTLWGAWLLQRGQLNSFSSYSCAGMEPHLRITTDVSLLHQNFTLHQVFLLTFLCSEL